MKKLLIICLSFILAGCSAKSEPISKSIFAMDTVMEVKIYGGSDEILTDTENEIKRIEKMLKRSDPSSEIYSINTNEKAEVSEETAEIIKKALDIGKQTDGKFDITIAPVMDLWGFYGEKFYLPEQDEINASLEKVDYSKISVDGNTVLNPEKQQIDLGGIAKGFTSDKIMELFREKGVKSGIVSLGGNVQATGTKPDGSKWTVAVKDPFDSDRYAGILKTEDKAVVTSGGYERFFVENGKKYHHIIDPSTGFPAENGIASVSIVSSSGILADALSTALFVMGMDKAVEYWKSRNDFDAVFVADDGNIYITEGIKDFFESDNKFGVITR